MFSVVVLISIHLIHSDYSRLFVNSHQLHPPTIHCRYSVWRKFLPLSKPIQIVVSNVSPSVSINAGENNTNERFHNELSQISTFDIRAWLHKLNIYLSRSKLKVVTKVDEQEFLLPPQLFQILYNYIYFYRPDITILVWSAGAL